MLQLKNIGKFEGGEVQEVDLCCGNQVVTIMNYGCVIRDWKVAMPGEVRHVVLGFEEFDSYPLHSPSFGIIAGRVANRTAGGRFKLGDEQHQLLCNDGNNHLHGGPQGLGKRLWAIETDTTANAAELQLHSPDTEQGYPGNVDFTVVFSLDEAGLHIKMSATPDCATPINLAQHNYYNLDGAGSIREHKLQMRAADYLPVNEELIPTGDIATVAGTRFDFRESRTIEQSDPDRLGHDHNLILDHGIGDAPAAVLEGAKADLALAIKTDQPGIQLYTGKKLAVPVAGHDAQRYEAFHGVCLEPQHFPDALNNPGWASPVCTPEKPYRQQLNIKLTSL